VAAKGAPIPVNVLPPTTIPLDNSAVSSTNRDSSPNPAAVPSAQSATYPPLNVSAMFRTNHITTTMDMDTRLEMLLEESYFSSLLCVCVFAAVPAAGRTMHRGIIMIAWEETLFQWLSRHPKYPMEA